MKESKNNWFDVFCDIASIVLSIYLQCYMYSHLINAIEQPDSKAKIALFSFLLVYLTCNNVMNWSKLYTKYRKK